MGFFFLKNRIDWNRYFNYLVKIGRGGDNKIGFGFSCYEGFYESGGGVF